GPRLDRGVAGRQLQEDLLQAEMRWAQLHQSPAAFDHGACQGFADVRADLTLDGVRAGSVARSPVGVGLNAEHLGHRLECPGDIGLRAAHHDGDAFGALEAPIQVLGRVFSDHTAVGDDHDARAGRGDLGQDVRAQDYGVLTTERLDQIARLDDLLRVEAA